MNAILSIALLPVLAALLVYALSPLTARLAVCIGAVDNPGPRRVHQRPIPRLGGVSVIMAVALAWTSGHTLGVRSGLSAELIIALGLGLVPVVVVSVIDDLWSVRPRIKFLGHLCGALMATSLGVSLGAEINLVGVFVPLGILAFPLSVLWIVGVTNAFNLIDGLDGLSAGLALIASSSLAAVFFLVGQPGMGTATLVISGALVGFLPYNLHPARLFLGDTGATAIGFALAAFALKGGSTLSSGFAVLIPVFILGLPIADTLVAVARRLLGRFERGTSGVFAADQNHIHHRLLGLGLDHRRAVLALYGVGLVSAGAAFVSIFLTTQYAALFMISLLIAALVGVQRLGYDEFALIRRGVVLKAFDAPVVSHAMFVVFADIALTILAAYVAVGLKGDSWRLSEAGPHTVSLVSALAPITVAVFWFGGMYRGTWRWAGVGDFLRASKAVVLASAIGFIAWQVLGLGNLEPTLFVVYGLVSLLTVTGSRASYVVLRRLQQQSTLEGRPALVYGAGHRGAEAVDNLYANQLIGFRPIGFIDDDRARTGRLVNGLPVVGPIRDLEAILRKTAAEAVLVSTPKIRSERLEYAAKMCQETGAGLFRARTLLEPLHELEPERRLRPEPVVRGHRLPDLLAVDTESVSEGPPVARHQPALTGITCPKCSSSRFFRSRTKSAFDRLRKLLSDRRPYRCRDCGWRDWLEPAEDAPHVSVLTFEAGKPQLEMVDQVLRSRLG